MSALELKVPPPVVALLLALAMWAMPLGPFQVETPHAPRAALAVALALCGLGLDIAGLVSFRKAHTTINPMKPRAATSLVRGGIYRLTRNPMYLGLSLVLAAWAVYLSSILALACVPAFVAYVTRFQIKPEERILASLFGPEYAAYCASVRRWL